MLRYLAKEASGHAMLRSAQKIYLDNTNMVSAIYDALSKKESVGMQRECFVINQMQNSGIEPLYTKVGDLKCGDYVFEISGKGKTNKQVKDASKAYILKDDVLHISGNTIPLYLIGFLS